MLVGGVGVLSSVADLLDEASLAGESGSSSGGKVVCGVVSSFAAVEMRSSTAVAALGDCSSPLPLRSFLGLW